MSDEAKPERPAGLWVVAILAIVLGGLGSCGSVVGLGSVAIQDSVVEMQRDLQQHEPNPELRRMNQELQQRSLEIAQAWRIPTVAAQIVNLVGSFALLIAAILLFRWHPNAPMIFIAAAALSIVADLAVGGVGLIVQQQTVAAMEEVTAGLSGADPAAERMMSGVMRASGTFGLCFALGWLAAKLAAYVGSIVYLRKETVRALFG